MIDHVLVDDKCPPDVCYIVNPRYMPALLFIPLARIGQGLSLDERINERGEIEESRSFMHELRPVRFDH